MASDDSYFEFQNLENLQSVKIMTQLFREGSYEQGVFQKNYSQKFLTDLYYFLQNLKNPPKQKYLAMLVLKQIILTNDLKIIGLISSSTQFLNFMQDIALKIDPKKPVHEKGKSLFPGDGKDGYGNKYVVIVLETVVYLGKKFPNTSKSQPTKFKKMLMKLESENVVLPQELTLYPKQKKKDDSSRSKIQSGQQPGSNPSFQDSKPTPKLQQTPTLTPNPKQKQKDKDINFESLLRFSRNKIDIYMADLEQAEQVPEMQMKILNTHEILAGYLGKFEELGDSVFVPAPGKSQREHEAVVEEYLKVATFLQDEKKAYESEIRNNSFGTYYDLIRIAYQKSFPQNNDKTAQNKNNIKKTTSVMQKQARGAATITDKSNIVGGGNNTDPASGGGVVKKQTYKSTESRNYNNGGNGAGGMDRRQSNMDREENLNNRSNAIVERILSNNAPSQSDSRNTKLMVTQLFQRLESKSKSPHQGFKQLRNSLQKQKSMIRANPPSRYTNPTNSNLKPITKSVLQSHLKTSKIVDPIFKNPPNPNPPYKNYKGDLVPPNRELENILYDIKKEQGHRRFKMACFKGKSLLFENQSLEIGCKTQPIFQSYDGFDVFLSMELYFGNKEPQALTNLQISFQGDQNCLIYTNPRDFPTMIDPQVQLKYELMVIPVKVPFSFVNMRLGYTSSGNGASGGGNGGRVRTTVALPVTILKLGVLEAGLKIGEYESVWPYLTKIFKTQPFKLSQHLPPSTLKKYLPNLLELTSYSQFSQQSSTSDYQLGGILEIYQIYQAVLKIIIRPDLSCVIQIGAREPSEDGIAVMRFYMESLGLVLGETGG